MDRFFARRSCNGLTGRSNAKKLKVPVKKILSGTPPEEAASRDSLTNPEALDRFAELAERIGLLDR